MIGKSALLVLGVLVCQAVAAEYAGGEQRTGFLGIQPVPFNQGAHQAINQIGQNFANLASALNPINVASNIAGYVGTIGDKIIAKKPVHVPITSTLYIQVTKTQTKYPVCMATASKVLPPCKVLSPPAEEHGHHHDANSAFHVGQGVGVLGQQLLSYPQLAQLAAYGAVPQAYAEHDQHVLEEQWHNQLRENQLYPELPQEPESAASEIKPTAVPKIDESTATATVESSRTKREVEAAEEIVSETTPLAETEPLRNPRFLQGIIPGPVNPNIPQLTKTVYVTKVEKFIDHHVTATVVPYNCVPDHVPMCPTKEHHKPQPHYAPVKAPSHYPQQHSGYYNKNSKKPSGPK